MRLRAIPVAVLGLAACAAFTAASAQSPALDSTGAIHYMQSHVSQTVICGWRHVVLDGSHTNMALRGLCRRVTLTGSHNDVSVEMARGGWFDITGTHNDVTWWRGQRGKAPIMQDRGSSNTFHPWPAYR